MANLMIDKNALFQALGELGVKDIGSPSPNNYKEYTTLVIKNGLIPYSEQQIIDAAEQADKKRHNNTPAAILKKEKMQLFQQKVNFLANKAFDPNIVLTDIEKEIRRDSALYYITTDNTIKEKFINNVLNTL